MLLEKGASTIRFAQNKETAIVLHVVGMVTNQSHPQSPTHFARSSIWPLEKEVSLPKALCLIKCFSTPAVVLFVSVLLVTLLNPVHGFELQVNASNFMFNETSISIKLHSEALNITIPIGPILNHESASNKSVDIESSKGIQNGAWIKIIITFIKELLLLGLLL